MPADAPEALRWFHAAPGRQGQPWPSRGLSRRRLGAAAVGAAGPLSSAARFVERVGWVGHTVSVSIGRDGGGSTFPAEPQRWLVCPVFHRQRDSIEAHLTIVFTALAVSRYLQEQAGASIKKLIQTLRAVRAATIHINGQELTLNPDIPPATRELLASLGHQGH